MDVVMSHQETFNTIYLYCLARYIEKSETNKIGEQCSALFIFKKREKTERDNHPLTVETPPLDTTIDGAPLEAAVQGAAPLETAAAAVAVAVVAALSFAPPRPNPVSWRRMSRHPHDFCWWWR